MFNNKKWLLLALCFLAVPLLAASKEIVLLETGNGTTGETNLSFVFWFYPDPLAAVALSSGTVSQWSGASAAENTAIQNGTVVEQLFSGQVPAGSTAAQIKAYLQARYAVENTSFHNGINPNYVLGSFWDGTTWTLNVSTVTKR